MLPNSSIRAGRIMQDLGKNPRVGFRIYDAEGEALYYKLGRGVHQIMCTDKKPKNRQRLNPRIGQIVDGVYQTTRPAKDHIFRNHNAWGISKFLVDNAEAFGFTSVQYTTPHGVGLISIIELVFTIDRKEVWEKQAGYEPQYLIAPEELGIVISPQEAA